MPKKAKLKKNATRKSKKIGLLLNKVFDQYKKKQNVAIRGFPIAEQLFNMTLPDGYADRTMVVNF